MSRSEICIFFLIFKLILVELKSESDAGFLSGIQLLYPKEEHLCGGVLISVWNVLTAASCVEGFEEGWNLSQLKLSAGDGSQIRRALTFSIHSTYNHETLENNLAVIKAIKNFNPNTGVHPIAILNDSAKDCFVVKWSVREKFITKVSSQSAMPVFLQPMEKCSMNISKTLCMGGDRNVTVCEEDYGCPLVCESLLAGIFIGPGHACDGLPGVYVDVKAYEKWLVSNSEHLSGHTGQLAATDKGTVNLPTFKFQLVSVILSVFRLS